MSWHNTNNSNDGLVCLVCDSKVWKHVDITWPNFTTDLHNIKLGLALDGVNPYFDLSTNHFTWPIFFLHYTLPPWLTTKRFFVMLALLMPWKEFVRNENIDVYLEPLLEKLEILWRGVRSIDMTKLEGSEAFVLRALCRWSLHDYHAYGLFVGCQVKGYTACPLCEPNVDTRHSIHLRKNVYLGHRQYLDRFHPY